jgi:CHAT domain-containing protein
MLVARSQRRPYRPEGNRVHRIALVGTIAAACVLAACSSYRMGDPIVAKPAKTNDAPTATDASGATAAPAKPVATDIAHDASAARQSAGAATKDPWQEKWRAIDGGTDESVGWVEHFQVCTLKYRYRNYGDLFRCLDLFDAKLARPPGGGLFAGTVHAYGQRVGPVLSAWLRSFAYADLGDRDASLRCAETAWAGLPSEFRELDKKPTAVEDFGLMFKPDDYSNFMHGATVVAGTGGDVFLSQMDDSSQGRRNPAALDMAPETIAMSLAAQRALLYQQRGDVAQAKAALATLTKWQHFGAPFKVKSQLLSLGALYAMSEYAEVVKTYDQGASKKSWDRGVAQTRKAFFWILAPVFAPAELAALPETVLGPKDTRQFAVALEDASNALVYAQSLARLGKTKEAAAMLDTLLAMPELQGMGNLYWATLYERATLALRDGKRDQAVELLEQSVSAIESVRSTIAFEAAKIGFAGDKQAVYAALVRALAERNDWQSAFLYAERAKARSLVDLLAERRDFGAPATNDSVRALLASASAADVGFAVGDTALRSIKVVADARAELATAAPEAASLVAVQSITIAQVAARLAPNETLIDYYRAGDDLFAMVLNGTDVAGFTLSGAGLDEAVRAFRTAIQKRSPDAGALSRVLYDRLVRPLTVALRGERLTISPHGVLHYLPFDALLDGDTYLFERYPLRVEPSADALVYLKDGHPTKAGTLLALGDPDLGDARYDLPNAQVEAKAVAALFPDSRALVRGDASKSAVETFGAGFAMLHFATHGKFDAAAPLTSGLYLAGTPPKSVLTVADLYALDFDVDLVTLSACETGLGAIANGDDVIGLTRGFLYAGARTIVASLWEVDDAATAELMVDFYKDLRTNDKREALRLAQLETRARFPQPFYWAAFQVIGRGD